MIGEIKAKIAGLRDVGPHQGPFNLDALQRYGAAAPSVRVVLTGFGKVSRHPSGQWVVPVLLAAVVITRDVPGTDRDTAVMALVAALQLLLSASRYGRADVGWPDNLDARNEYSPEFDKIGLAIWQVVWSQEIRMGDEADEFAIIGQLSALWINNTPAVVNGEVLPVGAPGPDPLGGGA